MANIFSSSDTEKAPAPRRAAGELKIDEGRRAIIRKQNICLFGQVIVCDTRGMNAAKQSCGIPEVGRTLWTTDVHCYTGHKTAHQCAAIMPEKLRNTVNIVECGQRYCLAPQEAASKPRQPPTSRLSIAQHGEFVTFFC